MKENDVIIEVLKKYDLTLPLTWLEKRRIRRAKRRTLAVILSRESGGRLKYSVSIFFSDIMKAFGIDATLAAGWRAASASATLSLILIAGGSVLITQHSLLMPGFQKTAQVPVIAGSVTSGRGTATGVQGSAELTAGGSFLQGDHLKTGEDSVLLLKMSAGADVAMLSGGSIKTDADKSRTVIELYEGCVISKVPSPFSGLYEVRTPGASVTVKGTVFAVIYNTGKTSVLVSEGVVSIKDTSSGVLHEIESGYYVEAGAVSKGRRLSGKEASLLKEFEKSSGDSTGLQGLNGIYKEMISEKADNQKMTLNDIKKKYGQIDEILLYSGKRFTGAVISRGVYIKIMTVNGVVTVPSKDVKNVTPK